VYGVQCQSRLRRLLPHSVGHGPSVHVMLMRVVSVWSVCIDIQGDAINTFTSAVRSLSYIRTSQMTGRCLFLFLYLRRMWWGCAEHLNVEVVISVDWLARLVECFRSIWMHTEPGLWCVLCRGETLSGALHAEVCL